MDVAAKRPMRTDCLFWIASMSKPMTATGLMMLVDEGRVSLDDPVEKYLPEFQGQMLAVEQSPDHVLLKRPAHPITVREVLSHTSGLPFMSRIEHKIDTYTLSEAAISYALTPLTYQPGTKHVYSNAGINTAGRIIEVVSGMPYEEFMEKRLFQPLGMSDTTFWPNQEQLARLAKSYLPERFAASVGRDDDRPTHLSLEQPQARSLAGRRAVLHGKRRGHLLPHDPRRRRVPRQAVSLDRGHPADDLHADRRLARPRPERRGLRAGLEHFAKLHGPGDPVPVGPCGHGGAYSTNMWIDPPRGLVMVYMVQHAGYPGKDGPRIQPAFQKAAETAFAK